MTATAEAGSQAGQGPLSPDELARINAYWRAANYLSVGQIYLLDNPLLRGPLRLEHVKPRLLGHWGTTPGLNFVYAHMNRVIRREDLDAIYVTGPGHGGPGLVANVYLEGTYSEVYPHIGHDEEGLRRLFRQFSFPGGIPSHVAPETPGSINEGGELGYSLVHAYGAAFDNPDLLVCCVVGDGEAETGPLAASWHSNKFLNPVRDGAVLPILHLNGYKIANPTILARIPEGELRALLQGYGYAPRFVAGSEPEAMHQLMAATLDEVVAEIRAIWRRARVEGDATRPRWPMIVLRTPKAGPAPGRSMASRWRVPSAPTRSPWPGWPSGPTTWPPSRPGYAPTGPRSCSTRPGPSAPSSPRSRRLVSGAWGPTRTPMAADCSIHWSYPTSAPTRSTCPSPGPPRPRPPASSAGSSAT
jgi:xylulose-5-phosphate/fructose-6-phosphate phosphoketolase